MTDAAIPEQPSADVVERVAKAIYEARYETAKELELGRGVAWEELAEHRWEAYRQDARAALSAIPQPAEVVGPAWRDKPDAEGWWARQDNGGAPYWQRVTCPADHRAIDGFRWFGPVHVPDDKAGA